MSGYNQNRTPSKDLVRVVVELDESLVEAVDGWGIPAGMKSRVAAIRSLLTKALEKEAINEKQQA